MRVLFWGTPDFALPSLRALTEEGHDVVGVVTQPDRPAGRGRQVRESPVKRECRELEIAVVQPERPRGEEFLARLRALEPEISVVAAYGELLPEEVLELPPRGSINVHASLLPELRGAAPVNWAIIRGHARSGVTIMSMVPELDAGPILHQIPVEIPPDMTAGELFSRTSELGAEALVEALALLEAGALEPRPQDEDRATYAPKLSREDARLDWSLAAGEVGRWIRGCDPWPTAWSELRGRTVQLFEPTVEPVPDGRREERGGREGEDLAEGEERRPGERPGPGAVLEADPRGGVLVAAGRGAVRIGSVKPAGRERMTAAAWVRGRGVRTGDLLR